MMASTHSRIPKFAITWGGLFGCISAKFRDRSMFYETDALPDEPAKVRVAPTPRSIIFLPPSAAHASLCSGPGWLSLAHLPRVGQVWETYCMSKRGKFISSMLPGLNFITPGRMLFFR